MLAALVAVFVLGIAAGAALYHWLLHRAPTVLDDAARKVENLRK